MVASASAIVTLVLAVTIYGVYRVLQIGRRRPNMPSGPPTVPILGNALQIPVSGFYKQFPLSLLTFIVEC